MLKPAQTADRLHCLTRNLLALLLVVMVSQRLSAESPSGILRLERDAYLSGHLVPHDKPHYVAWWNPDFTGPFEFPVHKISSIGFDKTADEHQAKGMFGAELVSGSVIFGRPVTIDDSWLTLDSPLLGSVQIERSAVRRLFRWDDGEACIFHGPGAFTAWEQVVKTTEVAPDQVRQIRVIQLGRIANNEEPDSAEPPKPASPTWVEHGWQLETTGLATPLYRDVHLSPRVTIELELAWESDPNFVIALATDGTDQVTQQAYRIEIWNGSFVLVRELADRAVARPLGEVKSFNGHLKLSIDLDQVDDEMTVYGEDGRLIKSLKLDDGVDTIYTGMHVANISGHLRVERIDVLRGTPRPPVTTESEGATFATINDQITTGLWTSLQDGQLTIKDGDTTHTISLDQLLQANFNAETPVTEPSDAANSAAPNAAAEKLLSAPTQLFSLDGGVRLAGSLQAVTEDHAIIVVDRMAGELSVPLSVIRGFRSSRNGDQKAGLASGRTGRLMLSDTSIPGVLMDGLATDTASCLNFAPKWATGAVPLKPTANGEIIYRDENDNKKPTRAPRPQNNNFIGAMVRAFAGGNSDSGATRFIHLRTGDSIPASVRSITEEGVYVNSVVTGEQLIPHERIKAVELRDVAGKLDLEEAQRRRLLTVPRIRKKSPPRHLLVSTDGDFLRGNIVRLTEDEIELESRLETITVATRRVAKIIWFHEDEIEDPNGNDAASPDEGKVAESGAPTDATETQETASENPKLLLQAVQRDGIRLTFHPTELGGNEVVGESDLLGACLVNLASVDRILFGTGIEAERTELPFYEWRLTHALEPAVYSEGSGEGGQMAGTESPLVGQPAPDFRLKTLEGEDFQVNEQKGHVLVLDFWATWCGPCLHAMPMIDAAVAEFPEDQVRLIAVNLQESPEQIRTTLERLGIEPTVVLDIDGVAAARYQANAIPQTVVIDREGKITRLFVGGGPNLQQQLTTAINQALGADPSPPSAP